jgi:hypothetical protein
VDAEPLGGDEPERIRQFVVARFGGRVCDFRVLFRRNGLLEKIIERAAQHYTGYDRDYDWGTTARSAAHPPQLGYPAQGGSPPGSDPPKPHVRPGSDALGLGPGRRPRLGGADGRPAVAVREVARGDQETGA